LDLSSVRRAATVADLTAIFETSANVVLHPRRLASGVQAEAERAASQRNFRLIASIAMSPSGAFEPPLALVELPALAADVLHWVEAFAELTGANLVGVRMARLEAPMCPRFHTDRVTLRLVATYLGPGTEVLAEQDVDRSWLGHAAKGRADELSGLMRPGAQIVRAAAGDVVLLKGDSWPGNAGRGAIHRSPAQSANEARLVLTLDALR